MGKKARPKLQKKHKLLKKQRKQREARRARHTATPAVTAYTGGKYRSPELVPLHLAIEQGILAAFHETRGNLTDPTVAEVLEALVLDIRAGRLSAELESPPATPDGSSPQVLLREAIRDGLRGYQARSGPPTRDDLVGVLRSILGSVETHRIPGPASRGYLHFLVGFMKKVGPLASGLADGVLVLGSDAGDDEDDIEDAEDFDDDEHVSCDELLSLGQMWRQTGNPDVGVLLRNLGQELIEQGEAEYVAETCQQLIGEEYDPSRIADLSALALKAQAHVSRLT